MKKHVLALALLLVLVLAINIGVRFLTRDRLSQRI